MGNRHTERHLGKRGGWLRAAVLGAHDGLVSTASLMVGVASAGTLSMGGADHVLVSGFAGLVAGAMSMAAGEYVSLSSQADGERADLARERRELAVSPQMELAELAGIYEARGLDPALAQQVAEQLTRHDAMDAHARDELGLTEVMAARPQRLRPVTGWPTTSLRGRWPATAAALEPGSTHFSEVRGHILVQPGPAPCGAC